MQIKLSPGGVWHRRAIGGDWTACGHSIRGAWASRDATYLGELCQHGCFSPYEMTNPQERPL